MKVQQSIKSATLIAKLFMNSLLNLKLNFTLSLMSIKFKQNSSRLGSYYLQYQSNLYKKISMIRTQISKILTYEDANTAIRNPKEKAVQRDIV